MATSTPPSVTPADAIDALSRRRMARIAGALYVVVIFGGIFAGGVQESLTVKGDAAATAGAIAAHPSLWRWGIGVHLVYLAGAATVVNVLLYRIFKHVQATGALLAFAFNLASIAIEGAAILLLYVPLTVAASPSDLAALSEADRQALAYLAVRLYETGFGLALFFFSGFCAAIGLLILRSRFVPRVIGVLMVVAGACYFVNSLVTTIAPGFSSVLSPWIILPCFLGEASFAIWLLAKGTRAA